MEYIGTSEEVTNIFNLEEDEEEEWEEKLSTEVLVLRIHQEWCSKKTWEMWAPTETRKEVATRWLRRRRLEGFLEPDGLFHPRVYGVEPAAIATI